MKKVLSLVLAAGLGLGMAPQAMTNTPLFGDVNGDGVINSADVTMLRRYIAAFPADTPANRIAFRGDNPTFNVENADVMGDGISANSVAQLRRHISAADPETVRLGPGGRQYFSRSDFPAGRRFIAVTFDDGPNTRYTVQILDELRRLGAYATFYINASKINDTVSNGTTTRAVVQRMIREGHDVDNHGWDHRSFGGHQQYAGPAITTAADARTNIRMTSQAIFDATGYWPFSFRAPFFSWGGAGNILSGLDQEHNMPFIDSQIDTLDFQRQGSGGRQQIANTVLNATRTNPWPSRPGADGGIILMHDCGGSRPETVASLALFIPQMKARGYEFVTVRQLYEILGAMPEMGTGTVDNMWPRVNQWVPASDRPWTDPTPMWPNHPQWWNNRNWYTDETPPWLRNPVGTG